MARCQVRCSYDGTQVIDAAVVVIDDEDQVYRFTCPKCGTHNEKELTDAVREVLRSVSVATIEEIVQSASVELTSDEAIWKAMLT